MAKKYQNAEFHLRAFAKILDFIIAFVVIMIFGTFGLIVSLFYILFKDTFFKGQSVGKKIFAIRVVDPKKDTKCSPIQSLLRNLPFAVVILLPYIPFLGWFLFYTLGAFILFFEAYLVYNMDYIQRIGDILAETRCVNEV